jgi:hypothetical protein
MSSYGVFNQSQPNWEGSVHEHHGTNIPAPHHLEEVSRDTRTHLIARTHTNALSAMWVLDSRVEDICIQQIFPNF